MRPPERTHRRPLRGQGSRIIGREGREEHAYIEDILLAQRSVVDVAEDLEERDVVRRDGTCRRRKLEGAREGPGVQKGDGLIR